MSRQAFSLTALALVGCSGSPTPAADDVGPATSPSVEQRDALVVAISANVETLVSVVSTNALDEYLMSAMGMPLVDLDFDCSLKKDPGIAKSYTWNADGTVLSMELRDDLVWSDGVPVTPNDIAFTYALVTDRDVNSPRSPVADRLKPDARPKIVDSTHIEWHFTEAYDRDAQVAHVNLHVLPAHALEKADKKHLKGDPFNKSPIVDGPFRLTEYEPNTKYTLEPNPKGPPDRQAHLRRVVFQVVPQYETRLLKLKKGEVDMMMGVRIADADALRASHAARIRLMRRGYNQMDYVAWNLDKPVFNDVKVRRAMAMAVDIDGMIDKLLTDSEGQRYAKAAVSTITPELCNMYNDAITPYKQDLDAARALLAEAGWSDSNGDKVLDRDGTDLSFTLMTNEENQRRTDTASMLQAQLAEVGIQVEIEKVNWSTLTTALDNRNFDAVLGGWEASLYVDPSDIWHSNTPDTPAPLNYTNYANPRADDLIERGFKTPDPTKAAKVWKELQQVVYEDQPYLFLWWRDEIVAIDARFENAHVNVKSPIDHLHEWSVPAAQVKYDF